MLVSCFFSSNHFWYHWLCSWNSGRSRIYRWSSHWTSIFPGEKPESSAVVVKVCGCLRGCVVKPGWIENMQPNSQLVQIKLCGCKSVRNDNCRLVENWKANAMYHQHVVDTGCPEPLTQIITAVSLRFLFDSVSWLNHTINFNLQNEVGLYFFYIYIYIIYIYTHIHTYTHIYIHIYVSKGDWYFFRTHSYKRQIWLVVWNLERGFDFSIYWES